MFRLLIIVCALCSTLFAKPLVLVSVAPQKYLIEQIAGDQVSVAVIVPDGASPHTYEPTPKQMVKLGGGDVWFRIGESFESRLLSVFGPTMEIVDQRDGIDLLHAGCCCCHDGHDPHIWLSPSLLKQEAKQIEAVLSRYCPEKSSLFQKNYLGLCNRLEKLDEQISEKLEMKRGSAILVSHPAFGYFCRDYGLKQIAIETEGKEPSSRRTLELIDEARKANICSVYLQQQYSMRGGKKIAKELGAEIVMVNPYDEDVISNLTFFAATL